jgi:hypothetical protein
MGYDGALYGGEDAEAEDSDEDAIIPDTRAKRKVSYRKAVKPEVAVPVAVPVAVSGNRLL